MTSLRSFIVLATVVISGTVDVHADTVAPPTMPRHAVAEAGDGRVLVSWDQAGAPTAQTSSYVLTATPGNIARTLGGSARSALLTGLANGRRYEIDVTALASDGTASEPVRLFAVPDAYACQPKLGRPRCQSLVRAAASARAAVNAGSMPLPGTKTPQDLAAAYGFAWSLDASTTTVAIVDAYDDGTAESDLAVYRSQYGLPACTTADGCFRKVDQTGGTAYPANAPAFSWQLEISLDLDMVSATCPSCHILLVESSDDTWPNLLAAEDEAAALGATAISNSWGSPEFAYELGYDSHFAHDGVPITASSGDSSVLDYPAASPYVTAVGGTTMTCDGCETAWSESGHGCSLYEAAPPWQTGTGCTNRAAADVAAIADPGSYSAPTGVSIYDSLDGGWFDAGGTSAGAPIIAATYAVAALQSGPAQRHSGVWPANPWRTATSSYLGTTPSSTPYLRDITGGPGAAPGYDQPTGLGTPNGIGAFQSSLVYRAVALDPDGHSGYALDGYGGLHAFNAAPPVSNAPYWPGWDIARGLAVCTTNPSIVGGYVLDGLGGVHPFGNAPPVSTRASWSEDIARGIVLHDDCETGYVVDGHGGIHAFAAAGVAMPADWPAGGTAYWNGRDIARAIVLRGQGCAGAPGCDNASGYVLDGTGGVHPFGGAPQVSVSGDWTGRDIARSLVLVTDGENPLAAQQGVGGYVLDGFGGRHAFYSGAQSSVPLDTGGGTTWPGWDVARGLAFDPREVDSVGPNGQALVDGMELDGYGGTFAFAAPPVTGGF